MRVQLTIQKPALNGFLVIDPTCQPGQNDRVLCQNITNLDDLVDNNECEEIICEEVLDYLPLPARLPALSNYLTKIQHGGTIVITGLCPYEASRLVHQGQLSNLQQINALLYGTAALRKSIVPAEYNVGIAVQTGQFVVEQVKYANLQYVIVMRRK